MIRLILTLGLLFVLPAHLTAQSVTLTAAKDSDIYAFFDGPSYSIFDLNIGAGGTTMAHSHHALLQFNLASLPITAAQIGTAKLRLFSLLPDSPNGGGLRPGNVSVHRQGAAWAVSGLRWSHLRPQEKIGTIPVTQASVNQWVELDITELVKSWASGALENHGLLLRPESETLTPSLNVIFASMEITNFAPQLVIERAVIPPTLSITALNGQMILEWPTLNSSGWILQQSEHLTRDWVNTQATPISSNGKWTVTHTPGPTKQGFFRLAKPGAG